jgi:hypothetical protein
MFHSGGDGLHGRDGGGDVASSNRGESNRLAGGYKQSGTGKGTCPTLARSNSRVRLARPITSHGQFPFAPVRSTGSGPPPTSHWPTAVGQSSPARLREGPEPSRTPSPSDNQFPSDDARLYVPPQISPLPEPPSLHRTFRPPGGHGAWVAQPRVARVARQIPPRTYRSPRPVSGDFARARRNPARAELS